MALHLGSCITSERQLWLAVMIACVMLILWVQCRHDVFETTSHPAITLQQQVHIFVKGKQSMRHHESSTVPKLLKYNIFLVRAGSCQGSSLVVMSKGTRYTQQSYKVSDAFPFEWIKKKWKENFYITSMATAGQPMAFIFSEGYCSLTRFKKHHHCLTWPLCCMLHKTCRSVCLAAVSCQTRDNAFSNRIACHISAEHYKFQINA